MTLNPDLVRARCNEIEESVQRLEALANTPLGDFLADRDARDVACYRLLEQVHALIRRDLGDLRAFTAAVVALL